ncbi:MAG: BCD family MFS transporter [Rhodobacteraceae bacterium]|nr:BCD family MFS transporter [Paracoccaceae bacterium]
MTLTWLQILRLGLVQLCLGAVVVLTTSTLNRLMVVELALPAVLPGMLVAFHYGVQLTRPNWGLLSDRGGTRTRFILGGMAVLALGGFLAALGVVLFPAGFLTGLSVSVIAYALIGLGVGASGTSLLALLATATAPGRRAAAAMITWLMMIGGIAVTAGTVGHFLEPYSPALLLRIVGVVTLGAVAVTALAIAGIERRVTARSGPGDSMPFMQALGEIWGERQARNFTLFVFLSMTAYFMQELILEPYAGLVFGFTPGESTALGGPQHGGAFLGMLVTGIAVSALRIGSLRAWVTGGCLGSALALVALAVLGQTGLPLLVPAVAALGFFNGIFAVAAIGAMMALAGEGRDRREGTRMGLWGAAQAVAAGFGGLAGAALADALRRLLPAPEAFGTVFLIEAGLFLAAALMAVRILGGIRMRRDAALVPGG